MPGAFPKMITAVKHVFYRILNEIKIYVLFKKKLLLIFNPTASVLKFIDQQELKGLLRILSNPVLIDH